MKGNYHRAVFAALRPYGFDRPARLAWASAQLDRDVESFTDLTDDDARILLRAVHDDELEDELDQIAPDDYRHLEPPDTTLDEPTVCQDCGLIYDGSHDCPMF